MPSPDSAPEVARLQGQRPFDVGDRGLVLAHQVVHGGPLVPAFGEFRVEADDGIEELQRVIELADRHRADPTRVE